MPTIVEPVHLQELWAWTRATNQRLQVHRDNPTATGRDDRFTVRITSRSGICRMECKTTNLESAATLLLDRLRKENHGDLPHA